MTRPPSVPIRGAAALCGLLALSVALAGCGATQPFSAAPRLKVAAQAPPSKAAPTRLASAGTQVQPQFSNPQHRQYFDAREKRYYFFDPATRTYYWENGAPR